MNYNPIWKHFFSYIISVVIIYLFIFVAVLFFTIPVYFCYDLYVLDLCCFIISQLEDM